MVDMRSQYRSPRSSEAATMVCPWLLRPETRSHEGALQLPDPPCRTCSTQQWPAPRSPALWRERLQACAQARRLPPADRKHATFTPRHAPRRNPGDQHEIFDATQSYFDQLYTTLSALASVQHRCGHLWAPRVPPTRSVEKYIRWWADHSEFMFQDEVIPAFEAARDYRTLTVHSQQKPVFDWRTLGYGPPTHVIGIVLFGQVGSSGHPLDGAVLVEGDDSCWEMSAPNKDDSLWAMLILSGMDFPHSCRGDSR